MSRGALGGLLVLATALSAAAQDPDKVIDVRATRPPAGNSFEALWSAYRKAERAGDAENSQKVFREIRRLRIERNIRSLEELALALVSQGLEKLEGGDRERAEEHFRGASGLDPHLPDAYFGLALAELKKGFLGFLPAARDTLSGLTARVPTTRGRLYLLGLLIPAALLTALATATVLAITLVLRHGGLLLHDLEEAFGTGRPRSFALGVYAFLLLLPVITLQGYAWLPFWWLALLFLYGGRGERVVSVALLLSAVAVGPVLRTLEDSITALRNPLFGASVRAVEGGPDSRAIAELEGATREIPDDRDLAYLLAAQYRKAGRYDDAAAVYREILQADKNDNIGLNNQANLEFARGEFQAAIARYKAGAEGASSTEFQATFYYNQSLAHLQRFEYQPATEARSQADRLAGGLIKEYDRLWKYDKGDYAVVDLGLTAEQVSAKFAGVERGVGRKNVAGRDVGSIDGTAILQSAFNRFAAFVGVFGVVVLLLGRWRGKKMFTMRCLKCGTPFCKRCHLGAPPAGLCTQCYHLFVVRDGVSGPARNQKLLEVQKEDDRRERVFRVLSLLSPGAGHLYAHKTMAGLAFIVVWYGILALSLLAGRILPVTEASSALSKPWPLMVAGLLLLVTYVAANRARPDFEVVSMSMRRGGATTRGARAS